MSNLVPVKVTEVLHDRSLMSRFNSNRLDTNNRFALEREHAINYLRRNDSAAEAAAKDPEQFKQCLVDIALMGTTLNPIHKLAYLIPRGKELNVELSYMGMEQLALKSSAVIHIQTVIVRQGDEFKPYIESNQRRIHHVEKISADGMDDRKMSYVYCIATYSSGMSHVEIMPRREVWAVREQAAKNAKGKKQGSLESFVPFTWKGPFRGEMYKKAVLRRAYKHWPKSPDEAAQRAWAAMERNSTIDFTPDKQEAPKHQPSTPGNVSLTLTADMIEQLDAVFLGAGMEDENFRKRQLIGLASSFGYQRIEELPADEFDKIMERAEKGAATYKERVNG